MYKELHFKSQRNTYIILIIIFIIIIIIYYLLRPNPKKKFLNKSTSTNDQNTEEKNEIDISYSLLSILANEVNGDVVNFNKVYNNLEDAGLFMTVPEKINQQYLSEISSKLDNVLSGLKVLFESIEETNRSLRDIEQNTNEMSSNMYDVTNHLWDISSNLKDVGSSINANNILTGIQTYQLHQINKNTKPNKK